MRTMERGTRDYNKDVSSESDDDTCTALQGRKTCECKKQ